MRAPPGYVQCPAYTPQGDCICSHPRYSGGMQPLLQPFNHHTPPPQTPPCWFMRQAGRYLPEYRELREKAGDFLTLCYTPELASEVTLQPIRRFGMDGAIIFSDILVVPHGLGRDLQFIKGQGPKLEPLTTLEEVRSLDLERMRDHLAPVYEALRQTRAQLPQETTLLGFAGAPWTLLCYMLDGNGKTDFINARSMLYQSPELIESLMARLTEAVSAHLIAQIEAGAQIVQLFDSWAGYVPAPWRQSLLITPAKAIVNAVHEAHPGVPVICFPKGVGGLDYIRYANDVRPAGLSVDQFTDLEGLAGMDLPDGLVLQGNLDPLALVHDITTIKRDVVRLKQVMQGRPYIMNLGHGVLPATPPSHMTELIETIKGA